MRVRDRLRRMAAAVARAFRDAEPAKEEEWKKQFRAKLFLHDKNALVEEMKTSPEKVLYAATLLLNEDFRLSAGWILASASQEKADVTVAVPYLKEGLDSADKNMRSQSARTLSFHYMNTGDFKSLFSLAEGSVELVRRDVFDAINVYATGAHPGAVSFLADALGHPERGVREFAQSTLELAVELGDARTRQMIRHALGPLTRTDGVPNLAALRSAERICRSIDLREKRLT
ncbi:MAG TPA: hypothetical protein VLD37_03385 [Candidatus Bilamarchaeum sp.]|nr:hypothetical protein [Candidatus Bilamarchaeum sp.]